MIFIIEKTEKAGYIFNLKEICAYCSDEGEDSLKKINTWNANTGFKDELRFLPSFKGNFHKALLRISTIFQPKGIFMAGGEYFGIEHYLLLYAMEKLNFTRIFLQPPDHSFGSYINGSWNGMLGQVIRNKSDMVVGTISLTSQRFTVVNPTAIVMTENVVLQSRKPGTTPRWKCIYEEISLPVWILTVVFTFLIGIFLYCFYQLIPQQHNMTFTEAVFTTIRVLLVESVRAKQLSLSIFILLGFWAFGCELLRVHYIGSMQSCILIPEHSEKPIDSIKDFNTNGNKMLLMPYGSYWGKTIENGYTIEGDIKYVNREAGKEMVISNSRYVTIADKNNIVHQTIQSLEKRNPLNYGDEVLIFAINSWMVRKNCPYRDHMSLVQMEAQQFGLMEYYKRKMGLLMESTVRQKWVINFADKGLHDNNKLITFDHMQAIIPCFMYMYNAALLVFIVECLLSWLLQKVVSVIVTALMKQVLLSTKPQILTGNKTSTSLQLDDVQ